MLTVDVGNSSVGVARHASVSARGSSEGALADDGIHLQRATDPADAAAFVDGPCVGISVSAPRWAAFCEAVVQRGLPAPQRLAGVPLELGDARLAGSAGQDRLALALALQPGPAIAVDAGTALTLDVVDEHGVYRGGFIAPGPASALAGLARATDALPELRGEPVSVVVAGETRSALAAGAWGLALGGVDRLLEEALASLGGHARRARVVVTGGWGQAWARDSRHASRLQFDAVLVHRGLRRWAERA